MGPTARWCGDGQTDCTHLIHLNMRHKVMHFGATAPAAVLHLSGHLRLFGHVVVVVVVVLVPLPPHLSA